MNKTRSVGHFSFSSVAFLSTSATGTAQPGSPGGRLTFPRASCAWEALLSGVNADADPFLKAAVQTADSKPGLGSVYIDQGRIGSFQNPEHAHPAVRAVGGTRGASKGPAHKIPSAGNVLSYLFDQRSTQIAAVKSSPLKHDTKSTGNQKKYT